MTAQRGELTMFLRIATVALVRCASTSAFAQNYGYGGSNSFRGYILVPAPSGSIPTPPRTEPMSRAMSLTPDGDPYNNWSTEEREPIHRQGGYEVSLWLVMLTPNKACGLTPILMRVVVACAITGACSRKRLRVMRSTPCQQRAERHRELSAPLYELPCLQQGQRRLFLEFRRLRNSQIDLESAVSSISSYCRDY